MILSSIASVLGIDVARGDRGRLRRMGSGDASPVALLPGGAVCACPGGRAGMTRGETLADAAAWSAAGGAARRTSGDIVLVRVTAGAALGGR